MELQVPETARVALRDLAEWPDDKVKEISYALEQSKPTLILSDYVAQVASISKLLPSELEPVIESLASIHALIGSTLENKELIVEQISFNLQKSKEFLGVPNLDWPRFKKNLLTLLSFEDSLGVTAKAISVLTDHTNVFRSCRILTDVRPIFGSKPDSSPAAAMVVHSVNFVVRRLDRFEEIFISLDALDLQKLKRLIERAELKEQSLRKLVEKSGIQYLEPKQ